MREGGKGCMALARNVDHRDCPRRFASPGAWDRCPARLRLQPGRRPRPARVWSPMESLKKFYCRSNLPSGAKARVDFAAFTARLKSCPDTKQTCAEVS